MGFGLEYRCSKCKKEYSVSLYEGFDGDETHINTIAQIEEGKYGKQLKSLFEKNHFLAVDVSMYFYRCSICGSWKNEKSMDIYEYIGSDMKNELWWEEGIDRIPHYVHPQNKPDKYKLIYQKAHRCEKCNVEMDQLSREVTEEDMEVPCLKCGRPNKKISSFIWD